MPSRETREVDVAVVGAGFSGLAAARALAAAGVDAVVLEARERVGGRVDNGRPADGVTVDLGGTWAGPTQPRVNALAREHGIATIRQFDEGDHLLDLEGRVRRYKGTIPRVGPLTLIDLARLQFGFARAARRIEHAGARYAARAAPLDEISLDDWLRGRRHGERARKLLGIAGKTIWGADPPELSALYVLHYVIGAGGVDALLDTEGGAQHERFAGGAHEIAARVAAALGDRVLLGTPVERIAGDDERVTLSGPAATVRARRAIVALPPPLCEQIAFTPALPEARRRVQQGCRMGALTKCFAVYDEPFWRADGVSGEALSDASLASLTFDVSPPDASHGVMLGFVGGEDARRHAAMDEAGARDAVLEGFARLYGPRARRPDAWIQRIWSREPWSGGAPVAIAPPGVLTASGGGLREPCGRVHWAGTESAERWGGYIEGAIVAGERAAAEVLERL